MVKSALVTGGSGFIGSHLVSDLLGEGYRVIVLDDLSTGSLKNLDSVIKNPQLKVEIGSITQQGLVDHLVGQVDEVYHLAAVVGVHLVMERPLHMLDVNIKGSGSVLESCAKYRKKFFFASSSEVYGKSDRFPYSESSDTVLGATVNYRWAYACAKQLEEFYSLAYFRDTGLQIVVGRFFNTVGPRQTGAYGMVIPRMVQQALKNESISVYGTGEQRRCFGHVKDVVWGVRQLMASREAIGGIFNLGGNEEVSMNELARRIISKTNSKSAIEHIPYHKIYPKGFEDAPRRVPDLSRIQDLVGYKPKFGLDQILDDVISFYRG